MEIKPITVNCEKCKQDATLPFYFYDIRIITEKDAFSRETSYAASALGKAICPYCGTEIRKPFQCPIYTEDIIELAIRRS